MNSTDKTRLAALKLVIFDVDGVITDGKLYLGPDGQEWRSTHARDGLGLKNLQRAGLITAVISGRPAGGLEARLKNLGLSHLYFGQEDKLPLFQGLLQQLDLNPDQTAMVGDDTPDLPLITNCGMGFCPADAHPQVRTAADWIAPSNGGQGAVRDISDYILAGR